VHQLREDRGVCPNGGTKSRVVHWHVAFSKWRATGATLAQGRGACKLLISCPSHHRRYHPDCHPRTCCEDPCRSRAPRGAMDPRLRAEGDTWGGGSTARQLQAMRE